MTLTVRHLEQWLQECKEAAQVDRSGSRTSPTTRQRFRSRLGNAVRTGDITVRDLQEAADRLDTLEDDYLDEEENSAAGIAGRIRYDIETVLKGLPHWLRDRL